jgi:hypothetical protein
MKRLLLLLFALAGIALAQPAFTSSNATKLKGKPMIGTPVDGESWCLDAANNRYIPCSGGGGGGGVTDAQLQANARLYCPDSGANDTYSCTTSPAITALTTGMAVYVKLNTANTGAATVDVDAGGALAAKAIKLIDGATDPDDGLLAAGATYQLIYDGSVFRVNAHLDTDSENATSFDSIPLSGTPTDGQTWCLATGGASYEPCTPPTVDLTSAQLQANSRLYCADAGASDAYSCTTTPTIAALTTGMAVYVKVNTTNTGAATVDIDGGGALAAKAIKKQDGSTDPADGDLIAGNTYLLIYDGAAFRLNTVRTMLQYVGYTPGVCQNTTASLGFSLPASNPAVAACVTGDNLQFGVAQFADGGSALSVQGNFYLPADWITGLVLVGKWRTSETSGSVVWQVQTACVADGETAGNGGTGGPSWNTASTATDAAKGTANQLNDFIVSSVTVTGCAAGEQLYFKFLRDPDHASDSLAATAELVSLTFAYRRTI